MYNVIRLFTTQLAIVIALCTTLVAETNIQAGDSIQTVIKNMGKPTGHFSSGSMEFLTYRRGIIQLFDGKVTSTDLISYQEVKANDIVQKQKQAVEEAEIKRRVAKGTAIRDKQNIDEEFAELPAVERLAFWNDFHLQYPTVPITSIIIPIQNEIKSAALADNKIKLEFISKQIITTEEEIEILANSSGLSRAGLQQTRRKLATLRKNLVTLNAEKEKLHSIVKEENK